MTIPEQIEWTRSCRDFWRKQARTWIKLAREWIADGDEFKAEACKANARIAHTESIQWSQTLRNREAIERDKQVALSAALV
jgi:hypothetical protein